MKERFAQIRKAEGLSQEKFGNKLNMSRTGIASIESGQSAITDRTIADICRVFNINEEWLRIGEGPMHRPPMTADNELAASIGELINSNDEFTKNFLLGYLKLSDEAKEEVKDFIRSISKFV